MLLHQLTKKLSGAEIEKVTRNDSGVIIHLRDGRSVEIGFYSEDMVDEKFNNPDPPNEESGLVIQKLVRMSIDVVG